MNDPPPRRSPLPKRRGRNEDPVGKQAKAARVAKAKATKKAKAEEKQKQAAKDEAAKDKLMEIEIDESFAKMQEDQQRIRRLSDMAMSDDENGDGPEDEATDQNDHEESSDDDNDDNDGSKAESESSADETELSRKRAPKVSFGLNSIQIRILIVTSRVKKRR